MSKPELEKISFSDFVNKYFNSELENISTEAFFNLDQESLETLLNVPFLSAVGQDMDAVKIKAINLIEAMPDIKILGYALDPHMTTTNAIVQMVVRQWSIFYFG